MLLGPSILMTVELQSTAICRTIIQFAGVAKRHLAVGGSGDDETDGVGVPLGWKMIALGVSQIAVVAEVKIAGHMLCRRTLPFPRRAEW